MQSEGADLKTTVKTADVQSSEKQGIFTCHAFRQTDRWTEMSLNIQKKFPVYNKTHRNILRHLFWYWGVLHYNLLNK